MTRRGAIKRSGTIDFAAVIGGCEQLRAYDELWTGLGYRRAGARGWQCSDGSYSLTLTWRKREKGAVSSLTHTIKGLRS
jgi:hypothetical protein